MKRKTCPVWLQIASEPKDFEWLLSFQMWDQYANVITFEMGYAKAAFLSAHSLKVHENKYLLFG